MSSYANMTSNFLRSVSNTSERSRAVQNLPASTRTSCVMLTCYYPWRRVAARRPIGCFMGVLGFRAAVAVAGFFACAPAAAQSLPGAEHKALGVFVGRWVTADATTPQSLGTVTTEWLPGNFGIVDRGDMAGGFKWLEVISYDSVRKVYTLSEWTSDGTVLQGTGSLSGRTLRSMSDMVRADGRTSKLRCAMEVPDPPTSLTVTCDESRDGQIWRPAFELHSTKKD